MTSQKESYFFADMSCIRQLHKKHCWEFIDYIDGEHLIDQLDDYNLA